MALALFPFDASAQTTTTTTVTNPDGSVTTTVQETAAAPPTTYAPAQPSYGAAGVRSQSRRVSRRTSRRGSAYRDNNNYHGHHDY